MSRLMPNLINLIGEKIKMSERNIFIATGVALLFWIVVVVTILGTLSEML